MKRNQIIIMSLLAVSLLGLAGCSDSFLDVTPPDKATLQEYYNTYDHLSEALVATYNPMREYDWNGKQYAPLNFCSDVMGDDMWVGGASISDNQFLHKIADYASTANSSDALTGIWDQCYKGVCNANNLLTYISWNQSNLSADSLAEYAAEARVLRAFYYCQLWKFYGNIPFYMTNPDAPYLVDQKSADEVYTEVIKDLEDAIDSKKLPMRWDDANLGRTSQAMAYMLYAEMVMYQNDQSRYAKALGYLQEIINSGLYALNPSYANIFEESGEWSSESIFEINYKDDQAVRAWSNVNAAGGTVFPRMISPNNWKTGTEGVESGWGFGPVRVETYNMFADGDTRRDVTCFDARQGSYTKRYQDTGFFLGKYIAKTANNADQIADADLNFNNNLRIYRYAETLLDAAELLLRTNGSTAQAQEYLNLVHHRAGLTDNKAATIDNVIEERHLEFVGEGKRYWDLIRTGKAATVLVPDAYGYRTNTWSESKKYLPIPQSEIDAAQNTLTQNKY